MDGLTEKRREDLAVLQKKLGVTFHDVRLLHTALIHTSYANEAPGRVMHNERLEFLGDAVLELASSTYLYTHFPKLPEGELTKTRASIVCSATLAKIAGRLGLGDYLLLRPHAHDEPRRHVRGRARRGLSRPGLGNRA